jgi:molybdate transport system ATP-binding protein
MERGHVRACGALADLQTDAGLPLVARADAGVMVEGEIVGVDDAFGLTELAVSGGSLVVSGRQGRIGERRRLRIAAADVSLSLSAPADSTILNCLPARILTLDAPDAGPHATVILGLGSDGGGSRITARITRKSAAIRGLAAGASVYAQIKSVALVAARTARSA